MNRRLNRILLAATLAATTAVAITPATASADTVVMGSTLANNFDGGISTGPTLSVQLSFDPVTSPNPVVSPANGVITGWKVKSADDGAIYTLKVLRANGAVSLVTATNSNFSAIASVQAPSAVPAGTFVTTPSGVIFDYPASLPISKGDYIGVLTGGADDHVAQATTGGIPLNLIGNNFAGLPADGDSANLLADQQHDLLLQATIKFCKVPDVVGKAEAAATAAFTAADCASTVTKQRLRLRKIKKSFSKRKKKKVKAANRAIKAQNGVVISQGTPAGTTYAPPGAAVALTVGKIVKPKKKKKKH